MLFISDNFNLSNIDFDASTHDVSSISIMKTEFPSVFLKDELDFGHELHSSVSDAEVAKKFSSILNYEILPSSERLFLKVGDWALIGQSSRDHDRLTWFIVCVEDRTQDDEEDDEEEDDESDSQ